MNFNDFDFGKVQKLFEDFKKKAREIEERNKEKIFSVKSGGGMVEIKANGLGEVVDLKIDDSLLEDKESLEILLISAINDLIKMVEDNKKNSFLSMMAGLNNV